jgi:hypothetical protein
MPDEVIAARAKPAAALARGRCFPFGTCFEVGWVEQSENPSPSVRLLMGFALLNPSYQISAHVLQPDDVQSYLERPCCLSSNNS